MIAYNASDFIDAVTERQYREASFIEARKAYVDDPADRRGAKPRHIGVCRGCGETTELLHDRAVCGPCYSKRQERVRTCPVCGVKHYGGRNRCRECHIEQMAECQRKRRASCE